MMTIFTSWNIDHYHRQSTIDRLFPSIVDWNGIGAPSCQMQQTGHYNMFAIIGGQTVLKNGTTPSFQEDLLPSQLQRS